MPISQAQSISTNGPKHHIYPNTTPPNRKYNPIPPDITPESSASVSSISHLNAVSHSHSQHSIATLNAVAPPSLGLPLSMSSTMSSHAMSMESSKHGSPTVSPSPSSVGGPEAEVEAEASPTTSSERVVTPAHDMDMTETADIPDGAGEYLEKSIAFGGGQALPFAIEEEEEEEPVDTNANASANTDGTTPSSSSFYSTVSPEGPGSGLQKAERTRSSLSVGSKSRNLTKSSIKGRSLRKRIKRMFSSSKRFKAGDRVEI